MPGLGNFNFANLIGNVIFSSIGFVAFIYGKKNIIWRPMVIGVLMMVYPYFVPGTITMYLIGISLTAALYFWRD